MSKFFKRITKFTWRSETKEQQLTNRSEVEQLTTELIKDTEAAIRQEFQRIMQDYTDYSKEGANVADKETSHRVKERKILDKAKAQKILIALLKEIIANRKLLASRIERDVETGSLFRRYYGKMQFINTQTIDAFEKLQQMDMDKDAYEYQQEIYRRLTGKIYQEDVIPNDRKVNPDGSSLIGNTRPPKRPTRRWDILELLNMRKFVRMSSDDLKKTTEDYEFQKDSEIARIKEDQAIEIARMERANAVAESAYASVHAAIARKEESEAKEIAAQAKIKEENMRMEEAKATEKAAQARTAAEAALTEEAKAAEKTAQARTEAETARTEEARAAEETAQVNAAAEAARTKEAKATEETARAKAEAEFANAKAARAKVAAEAVCTDEVKAAVAEAELARVNADLENSRSKEARAKAEIARAEAEEKAACADKIKAEVEIARVKSKAENVRNEKEESFEDALYPDEPDEF